MAPGGRSGDDKDNSDRPSYKRSVSVEDVSGQAPEIVKSFLAVCFQQDGLEVPSELTPEQHKVNKDVAHVLRDIGDSLQQHSILNQLIAECKVTKDTAFETFLSVAMQIFQDGVVNWGRIVTLFYFGYKLAIQVLTQVPLIKMIIEWVVKFIKEKLVKWITEQGGWVRLFVFIIDLNVFTKYDYSYINTTLNVYNYLSTLGLFY